MVKHGHRALRVACPTCPEVGAIGPAAVVGTADGQPSAANGVRVVHRRGGVGRGEALDCADLVWSGRNICRENAEGAAIRRIARRHERVHGRTAVIPVERSQRRRALVAVVALQAGIGQPAVRVLPQHVAAGVGRVRIRRRRDIGHVGVAGGNKPVACAAGSSPGRHVALEIVPPIGDPEHARVCVVGDVGELGLWRVLRQDARD